MSSFTVQEAFWLFVFSISVQSVLMAIVVAIWLIVWFEERIERAEEQRREEHRQKYDKAKLILLPTERIKKVG